MPHPDPPVAIRQHVPESRRDEAVESPGVRIKTLEPRRHVDPKVAGLVPGQTVEGLLDLDTIIGMRVRIMPERFGLGIETHQTGRRAQPKASASVFLDGTDRNNFTLCDVLRNPVLNDHAIRSRHFVQHGLGYLGRPDAVGRVAVHSYPEGSTTRLVNG